MNTHNVLIIDDEYYICEGLSQKIRHLNLDNIGEIRTCSSAENALKLCKTYKPHIIFTDIKMGSMNGIELIHALNKKLYPVQFIVLSGYDDFNYVRGAFQNGAIDYLLKPVLNEDLSHVLTTALANLENTSISPEKLRSTLFRCSKDILQKISVLPPYTVPSPTLISSLEHMGITEKCCISLIAPTTHQSVDIITQYINHIYDTFTNIICNVFNESKLAIICNTNDYENLKKFLLTFIGSSDKTWCASLTPPAPISEIVLSFYKAEEMLCMRLFHGYGQLFTDLPQPPSTELPPKLKHLVTQFLENPTLIKNKPQYISFCKEIENLSLPDLINFFKYFNEILNINFLTSHNESSPSEEISIFTFSSYDDLKSYFYKRLTDYAQKVNHTEHLFSSADMIRNYIDQHYMEDLTLADLADRFFISYSYLSKSFRKTFHMSFQEYLRMLRMEHALTLLNKTDMTIQQIASAVGYENAFNFSRSFKAQYGISPSQFRNENIVK